jgi:hypothetical protein
MIFGNLVKNLKEILNRDKSILLLLIFYLFGIDRGQEYHNQFRC